MSRLVVVGSGASGVHFASTALEKGHEVLMLDVGREQPAQSTDTNTFDQLKSTLEDPAAYFLGDQFGAVTLPGADDEIYAFPPSKQYVFASLPNNGTRATGIDPLASFARGGLAEAWTAGVYPFNRGELADFPIDYDELHAAYGAVAARIGVNGAMDDLGRFFPEHQALTSPLILDAHSQALLGAYQRKKERLHEQLGCYIGRSRIATLTQPHGDRAACSYCGRCMWGCPTGAFYTPSITLSDCLRHPRFTYRPGLYVSHFNYDDDHRIQSVVAAGVAGGEPVDFPVDRLVLAAGTLSSSRIFLESIYRRTGVMARLTGLMDNRQVLVPYLKLSLVGAPYVEETYQYHQLAMGLEGSDPKDYVHGQITALTTGLVHPILAKLPLGAGAALPVFRLVRGALGVVNVNLNDTRRNDCYVTLANGDGERRTLVVNYVSAANEAARIETAVAKVRRGLRALGCVVPRGMVQIRPMGASVHYSGTLPMSRNGGPYTVTPECRSNDFSNLYLADGSTFPFLPAKNLTFTLMANATRIANRF
jgi:choline dehydrogenase-like flavoprotein